MSLELEPLDSELYSSMDADVETAESREEYIGPERRQAHRRVCIDRRNLVRFEIDKLERRADFDRRAEGCRWGGFCNI